MANDAIANMIKPKQHWFEEFKHMAKWVANITNSTDEDREKLAEEGIDYSADSIDFTSMILHWMHQWRLAALFMILSGCLQEPNLRYISSRTS